jgi:CHAD domain-containing protein
VTKPSRLHAGDVVRIALASSVARFDSNEPVLWTDRDPEAVHQARVATRRMRSDLGTLREFVDAKWAMHVRAELRWLGAELGGVRDVEVLHARLTLHAALLPDADAAAARSVIRRLDADSTAARADLLVALRSPRYAQLHRALHEAVISPPLTAAAETRAVDALPDAVRPMWRRLRRAVDDLATVPSDAALHGVRIRAKRCRYAAELAQPVMGKGARDFATAVTRVQDVLGEHQDAVIADSWLAKTAPECSPSEAYALGMLAEIERSLSVHARAALASAWDAARDRRLRAWM